MKRATMLLLSALCLVLVLAFHSQSALAADIIAGGDCSSSDGFYGDHVIWALDSNGVFTLSGTGSMKSFKNTDAPWEAYKESIKTVVVEDGVTYVSNAFTDCRNLTSVSLADSVTGISGSFQNCTGLTSIVIPDNVDSIGKSTFEGCTALKAVVLSEKLERIYERAFADCASLESITLPNGLKEINGFAFLNCTALKSVTVPESVEEFGERTFQGCTGLTSVQLPSGLEVISPGLFEDCDNLASLKIPESVTLIGWNAFAGCNALKDVELPAGLKELGGYAFAGCESLTSITVPDGITEIFDATFMWCKGLKSVVLPESVTGIGMRAFQGCETLETVNIPSGVTVIEEYLFSNCFKLKDIVIRDGVTTIKDDAFMNCKSFTRMDIPDSVTLLGNVPTRPNLVFNGCVGIKTLTIGNGLTVIGDYMFAGLVGLETATIGNSVETIGENAFHTCLNLKTVTIPNSVKSIKDGAFAKTGLTSIQIPDTVTTISPYAFNSCYDLSTVEIPNTVTEIGHDAFFLCNSLWHVMYGGTEEQWSAINVDHGNEELGVAVCHYNASNSDIEKVTDGEKTCTHKAALKCSKCGDVYMEKIPGATHTWTDATCTLPKTCSVCSATEGTELGHLFGLPTCTEPRTCVRCEETLGTANGHYFRNGSCTVCGAADPDYKEPEKPTEPTVPNEPTVPTEPTVPNEPTTPEEPTAPSIIRLAGATRYKTAFAAADELKKVLGVAKFDAIIVSSGEEFADALAGSYLASVKNAPILLVKDSTVKAVKEYIQANLNPGGTVYLLGGEKAVPKTMETGLEGFTVKRLGGNTRYDTNLLILQEAGTAGKNILVCTGKDFADSLSASAVGLPILLVKDSLTDAQKEFLAGDIGTIVIIGGENAVSKKMESQLISTRNPCARLSGATRYETSVRVAKNFFVGPTAAVIAYGENFPDGLSGGPVANKIGAPLILTREGREKDAAAYISERGIRSGYVLGGTTVLPEKTVNKVFGK